LDRGLIATPGGTDPRPYVIAKRALLLGRSKGKVFPYRPGMVQRVGRGIALLFHDRDTRRG